MSEVPTPPPESAPAGPPAPARVYKRRDSDKWFTPFTRFWDWIDDRDIDKWVVSLIILYGTVDVMRWAMHYAENGDRPGLEIAAIIAAVSAPYMALQGFAVKWFFEARQ